MPRDSMFLGFYQGVVPCCLGETMVLALEERAECFSLGRDLNLDRIEEIGVLARKHGFDFSQLFSFGQKLESSALARFRKAAVRRRPEPLPRCGVQRCTHQRVEPSEGPASDAGRIDHRSARRPRLAAPRALHQSGPRGAGAQERLRQDLRARPGQ